MEADNDIKTLRVLSTTISQIAPCIDHALWRPLVSVNERRRTHKRIRKADLKNIIDLIEPFQEEPQLLDVQLKDILPNLVLAFLQNLNIGQVKHKSTEVSCSFGISRILYTFCKVRGEKVVVSFLNNEARVLEPLLTYYERLAHQEVHKDDSKEFSWEERYIYLLWMSHLMLVPFDLQTLSSDSQPVEVRPMNDLILPIALPQICFRLLSCSTRSLKSATRERRAAASVIARMSLRPDMQKLGLLESILAWIMTNLRPEDSRALTIHEALGFIEVLSGIVVSATLTELEGQIEPIFALCRNILIPDVYPDLSSSAVARRLVTKIIRNLVIFGLQSTSDSFDVTSLLEDTIDILLGLLADSDSPVRFASSKALSRVALKLDVSMSQEVIEAVLGSLGEDVLWEGSSRNLTAVNPLRWHGLTLTMAHLLYSRAPPPSLLPEVINALILSLEFEQRSALRSSIGTNVRDAACFGLWAISRRYTPTELLNIKTSDIRAASRESGDSCVQQYLATQLIVAACLDPVGNIRRGSSAALQELIGRHPNLIREGIAVVQTVDYHAVGLRERAMVDVAFRVAQLDPACASVLFAGLLGWRGIGAVDANSREIAARAIGQLSTLQNLRSIQGMIGPQKALQNLTLQSVGGQRAPTILESLAGLQPRQIEERHGLLLALADVMKRSVEKNLKVEGAEHGSENSVPADGLKELLAYSNVLQNLNIQDRDFTAASQRPELTAVAICNLISAIYLIHIELHASKVDINIASADYHASLLGLCLNRSEESVRRAAGPSARNLVEATGATQPVQQWLKYIEAQDRHTERITCHDAALGHVFDTLKCAPELQNDITRALTSRCTDNVSIEARVNALHSLIPILESLRHASSGQDESSMGTVPTDTQTQSTRHDHLSQILRVIQLGLNNYTVNQRGDVGSLVRIASLQVLGKLWSTSLTIPVEMEVALTADATRVALEKLDKVRVEARRCLILGGMNGLKELYDVSATEYFAFWLLQADICSSQAQFKALIEGFANSAGSGAESITHASRSALLNFLASSPRSDHSSSVLRRISEALLELLRDNMTNERVLLPVMELVAFLLDMQILQQLSDSSFKWRNLLSLTQKSHYKSTVLPKLYLALEIYRGLAEVDSVRHATISKVVSMIGHPFPSIRVAAAETLFVISGTSNSSREAEWSTVRHTLTKTDWSRPPSENKMTLTALKAQISI